MGKNNYQLLPQFITSVEVGLPQQLESLQGSL